MECVMKLERETKGALLYKEVDASGNPRDMHEAYIGSLYIRKSSSIGKAKPEMIRVMVDDLDKV